VCVVGQALQACCGMLHSRMKGPPWGHYLWKHVAKDLYTSDNISFFLWPFSEIARPQLAGGSVVACHPVNVSAWFECTM